MSRVPQARHRHHRASAARCPRPSQVWPDLLWREQARRIRCGIAVPRPLCGARRHRRQASRYGARLRANLSAMRRSGYALAVAVRLAGRSYFYRLGRPIRTARFTVQRRIVGPLRILAGGSLEHTDFRDLPGESVFKRDQLSGTIRPDEVPFNDRIARAGVVLDWRDLETDPHRGVFVEGLVASGRGYTRRTGTVRVYVHPLDRLILAGRIAGEGMSGTPPVAAQFTMESSEGPVG